MGVSGDVGGQRPDVLEMTCQEGEGLSNITAELKRQLKD